MAGATFTITPENGSDITFDTLESFDTRMALFSSPGIPDFEYSEWHIPGTIGDVVANLGEQSRTIILTGIYQGTYPDILVSYEDDKIAMAGIPCTIVDSAGNTHGRCRLKESRENAPPKGTVDNFQDVIAYFVVQFTFIRHGETTGVSP